MMGVLVRIRASENFSAHLFHWASVGLGMVIVMTAGYYNIQPLGYGHFNRIIWLFAYSITPVLFIHFTSSFSKKKVKGIKYILWYFYVSAVINAIIYAYLFLDATVGNSFQQFKVFCCLLNSFFRLFLITCIVIAISICIYAYRSTSEIEEKKTSMVTAWIFYRSVQLCNFLGYTNLLNRIQPDTRITGVDIFDRNSNYIQHCYNSRTT